MHRLTKMDIKKSCNKYVEDIVIDNLNYWIEKFNSIGGEETLTVNDISYTKHELYMKIISNCPMGLEQTMRVTTNYLQLKTIYQQRKNHKLEEWHVFCAWCETLDRFVELCLKNKRLFTNDKGEII